MTNVQIFGVKNSSGTRAAERFFRERRIPIQMVDLKQKPMSAGEIKRFIDKYKFVNLIDREGKAFVDSGLAYMTLSETSFLAKIEQEPKLLKLPLVRCGKMLSIGQDEAAWKEMASS